MTCADCGTPCASDLCTDCASVAARLGWSKTARLAALPTAEGDPHAR